MMINKNKKYYTTNEVAQILGISRVAVFKKIKAGEIKAEKIGRNYAIPKKVFASLLGKELSQEEKELIDQGVKKTVKEYGETLKLLGRE